MIDRREQAARLARGLVGRVLPAVTLMSCDERLVELAHVAVEGLVIYTYPASAGSLDGQDASMAADAAQHRAFDRYRDDLRALSLQVVGLSSESPKALRGRVIEHRVYHKLWSDPDLLLARALGLPASTHEGIDRYPRMMIVARHGQIVKAFFPVDSPQRSASQVIWWTKATGS